MGPTPSRTDMMSGGEVRDEFLCIYLHMEDFISDIIGNKLHCVFCLNFNKGAHNDWLISNSVSFCTCAFSVRTNMCA